MTEESKPSIGFKAVWKALEDIMKLDKPDKVTLSDILSDLWLSAYKAGLDSSLGHLKQSFKTIDNEPATTG